MMAEYKNEMLMALLVGLLLWKWGMDRIAVWVNRQQLLEESEIWGRLFAFGLIAYSVAQDLRDPDPLLGLYWLLVGCWFYINNRARRICGDVDADQSRK